MTNFRTELIDNQNCNYVSQSSSAIRSVDVSKLNGFSFLSLLSRYPGMTRRKMSETEKDQPIASTSASVNVNGNGAGSSNGEHITEGQLNYSSL